MLRPPARLWTSGQFIQNRANLLRQLTEAKRQVEHGDLIIDSQRRIISSLIAYGEDATRAERL